MKYQPANGVVVLKPLKQDDLRARGIVTNTAIAAVVEKQPQLGLVLEIGAVKGKNGELPLRGLKRGDVVAYRDFGDFKFMIGMDEVIFVIFDDILSILKIGE